MHLSLPDLPPAWHLDRRCCMRATGRRCRVRSGRASSPRLVARTLVDGRGCKAAPGQHRMLSTAAAGVERPAAHELPAPACCCPPGHQRQIQARRTACQTLGCPSVQVVLTLCRLRQRCWDTARWMLKHRLVGCDANQRFSASLFMPQIAIDMLESGKVDAVVCVQADENDRFTPKPVSVQ